MASLNLVRWGALGALLAGVAWIASFIVDLAMAGQSPETSGLLSLYLIQVILGLALAGTLIGLLGLHVRQATSYGVLGTAGLLAALIGTALVLANVVFIRVAGRDLLDLLLGIGLVGMFFGLVLLGVATLLAKVLPWWCGVALIVVLPIAAILGDYGGGLVLGLVWLALGYVLLAERPLGSGDLRSSSRRTTGPGDR
jgi:hypothetical protein